MSSKLCSIRILRKELGHIKLLRNFLLCEEKIAIYLFIVLKDHFLILSLFFLFLIFYKSHLIINKQKFILIKIVIKKSEINIKQTNTMIFRHLSSKYGLMSQKTFLSINTQSKLTTKIIFNVSE